MENKQTEELRKEVEEKQENAKAPSKSRKKKEPRTTTATLVQTYIQSHSKIKVTKEKVSDFLTLANYHKLNQDIAVNILIDLMAYTERTIIREEELIFLTKLFSNYSSELTRLGNIINSQTDLFFQQEKTIKELTIQLAARATIEAAKSTEEPKFLICGHCKTRVDVPDDYYKSVQARLKENDIWLCGLCSIIALDDKKKETPKKEEPKPEEFKLKAEDLPLMPFPNPLSLPFKEPPKEPISTEKNEELATPSQIIAGTDVLVKQLDKAFEASSESLNEAEKKEEFATIQDFKQKKEGEKPINDLAEVLLKADEKERAARDTEAYEKAKRINQEMVDAQLDAAFKRDPTKALEEQLDDAQIKENLEKGAFPLQGILSEDDIKAIEEQAGTYTNRESIIANQKEQLTEKELKDALDFLPKEKLDESGEYEGYESKEAYDRAQAKGEILTNDEGTSGGAPKPKKKRKGR